MINDFPHSANVFPDISEMPLWLRRTGMGRNHYVAALVAKAMPLLCQLDTDNLSHLAPIVTMHQAPPAEIKKRVGGNVWREYRTSDLTENANRLAAWVVFNWEDSDLALVKIGKLNGQSSAFPRWIRAIANNRPKDEIELIEKSVRCFFRACKKEENRGNNPIEFKNGRGFYRWINLIYDFFDMGGEAKENWSFKRIEKEHDNLAERLLLEKSDPTPWAEPFEIEIQGNTFKLITSHRALAKEGAEMRHCIGSAPIYAKRIKSGRAAAFQVSGEERATLFFTTDFENENPPMPKIEIKGPKNKEVSNELFKEALIFAIQYSIHKEEGEIK